MQAAVKPSMDRLAAMGRSGLLDTIPAGMAPGSEIANLSVLGYDVPAVYEGRGVLEAASMGVELEPGDLAMRCNLICLEDNRIKNHSAGHITSAEAAEIIAFLDQKMGNEHIRFYPGSLTAICWFSKEGRRRWPAPRPTMSWAPLPGGDGQGPDPGSRKNRQTPQLSDRQESQPAGSAPRECKENHRGKRSCQLHLALVARIPSTNGHPHRPLRHRPFSGHLRCGPYPGIEPWRE